MFDAETMRKRFHELGRQREAILAEVDPLRKQRDELVAAYDAAVKPLEAKIKAASAGLFGIETERANIARALRGKTGAQS
jgi:uncharacterized coiled-coil DUF342 family protein